MSQIKGICGHFKAFWDNHPTCANCSFCFRDKKCSLCQSWSEHQWDLFENRRSYKKKMVQQKVTQTATKTGFSTRKRNGPWRDKWKWQVQFESQYWTFRVQYKYGFGCGSCSYSIDQYQIELPFQILQLHHHPELFWQRQIISQSSYRQGHSVPKGDWNT